MPSVSLWPVRTYQIKYYARMYSVCRKLHVHVHTCTCTLIYASTNCQYRIALTVHNFCSCCSYSYLRVYTIVLVCGDYCTSVCVCMCVCVYVCWRCVCTCVCADCVCACTCVCVPVCADCVCSVCTCVPSADYYSVLAIVNNMPCMVCVCVCVCVCVSAVTKQ